MIPIAPPRLRTSEDDNGRRATWLELFYDLAFVVGVAVLSERLLTDTSLTGLFSYTGYFGLLWWLWASHTFYADRFDTDDLFSRAIAAAQMAAVIALAASLSTGPAASTLAFAIAYATARWTLLLMYARAHRHVVETQTLTRGYLMGFGLAALVWTVSIAVPESVRPVVWVVALAIDLTTPWVMRREQAKVPLDVSHLPERFGLFTILVLGESIAALAAGLSHLEWSAAPVLTMTLGITVASALWWMYFENAEGTVVRRSDRGTARNWRPTVWIYTHLPLALSLAVFGVALEHAVNDAGSHSMSAVHRWLLVGAVAVALGGMALIQFASNVGPRGVLWRRSITINRLAAIPFLIVIGLLPGLEPQWVTAGVLGVCVAVLVADLSSGELRG